MLSPSADTPAPTSGTLLVTSPRRSTPPPIRSTPRPKPRRRPLPIAWAAFAIARTGRELIAGVDRAHAAPLDTGELSTSLDRDRRRVAVAVVRDLVHARR